MQLSIKSDRKIEVARERRKGVRSEMFPNIDLVGTVNYEKHRGAVVGTRRDMSVLLQANWDFFAGFTARANTAQAAYDYFAAQDNYDFVVRKVIEQTRLAWQALRTARSCLALLENAVNIASEVFESRKKLRAAGKETVINVLDAEGEISNARINFASALFDKREAVYRLLQTMGVSPCPNWSRLRSSPGKRCLAKKMRNKAHPSWKTSPKRPASPNPGRRISPRHGMRAMKFPKRTIPSPMTPGTGKTASRAKRTRALMAHPRP